MNALFDRVFDLPEAVGNVLEGGAAGEVLDREHGLEHGLQTDFLPLFVGGVHLQEPGKRIALHADEVGDIDDLVNLAEALANTLADHWSLGHSISAMWLKLGTL